MEKQFFNKKNKKNIKIIWEKKFIWFKKKSFFFISLIENKIFLGKKHKTNSHILNDLQGEKN